MDILVLLSIFAAFILITAKFAIKIVPQSNQWVITRLGARHKTLDAGVGFVVPFIDSVHSKVSIADQVLKDIRMDVVSADNVVFGVELFITYRIARPEEAVFRVNSVKDLIEGLVRSLVRAEIGKVELDALQRDRDTLNTAIRLSLAEAGSDYGIIISRAEITDVSLQESTQRAMAEVLEAERTRRATVTRAEGEKRAMELQADGELYRERKRGEAIEAVAVSTARATESIGKAIADHGLDAARFQISQGQIDAMKHLGESPNAKVVFLPGDTADGLTRAAALAFVGNEKA